MNGPDPPGKILVIRNAGGDTLRWKADVSDVAPWLSASPDSGRTPPGDTARVTVSVSPAGMPAGFYSGSVLVQNRRRPILDLISVAANLGIQAFTVEVDHDPETTFSGGAVSVTAEAGVLVDSARVYYRWGGGDQFESAAMVSGSGGAWEGEIPGSFCGIRGVEYWVAVHGAAGQVRVPDPDHEPPVWIDVWLEDEVAPDPVAGRHRMISVPLSTGGASVSDVMDDDLGAHDPSAWRFGRYETAEGKYAEHPADVGAPVDAGYGFWLIHAEDRKVDVDGFANSPLPGDSCFSIILEGAGAVGWNQIGHPFAYPVATAECLVRTDPDHLYTMEEAAQAGLVENAFYDWVYDGDGVGRYEEAEYLEPWRGYFVNNTSGFDLELLVPAREAEIPVGKEAPADDEGAWAARFRAYAAGRASQEVTLGSREGARSGRDAWDRSSPPRPDPSGPGLFVGDGLRADWRGAGGRVHRWTIRARPGGETEVRLRVSLRGGPPEGSALYLIDPVSGATLPLEDGTTYRFAPRPGETERALEAVSGPAALLAAEGIEARAPEALFRLDAPRPNPFVRGTALRYSLPERGIVSIRIYNLSGRLVRSLMEGTE